ncbi:MAG: Ig-like domain-containing protein [Gemmatimonadota bacterium]
MLKFYRNILAVGVVTLGLAACGDDVTIQDPPAPPPPGVTSVTVAPASATIAVGQNVVYAASVIADAGVSTAVTWTSSNQLIATVDGTGKVTGVAPGTTTIIAKSSADAGKTGVASVTVTGGTSGGPVQISIQSITTGLLTLPVVLSNVTGQIEVNMNFNSNGAPVDSINVFIGNKRAAKAIYATSPAAGLISLSINTAAFTTSATSPTATVAYNNGQSSISAVAYPSGGAPPTATQATQIVLNNADGWAGSITKPTVSANNAGGITYWGGPTANTAAQIWAVQYNAGRNGIETVTWTVGGCTTVTAGGVVGVPITTALTRTFGYVANGAQSACTAYENLGGTRDNIIVSAAIDGVNNGYPLSPLIANTVVFGATPDSLRLDYKGPTVSTPSIARTAPAVTGWVNAGFSFLNFSSTDFGVGLRATRDRAATYSVVNCPAAGATNVAMPTGTGADIPECGILVNAIGGAVGLGGTAPYTVSGTESDRLNNGGVSVPTATFGVDKTLPSIRWGTISAAPLLPSSVGVDTVFRASKPVAGTDEFRVEYLDDRAGFYNAGAPLAGISAQRQALSTAGHFNNAGLCITGTGPIGATFVTAPACTLAAIASVGPLRLDGWQAGPSITVPAVESYYGYTSNVTDAAGNTTASLFRKTLVNTRSPFATGLGLPATLTALNFGIQVTAADSAEVARIALQFEFPNMISGGSTDSVRYGQTAVGIIFDDVITSPYSGSHSPTTGAPFTRRIEAVTAGVFPASNVAAAGTPVNVKPTSVVAWSFNFGGTLSGGPAPARSAFIAIPGLNVQDGVDYATWNVANPTIALTHWRIISTVATTNQFGSVTPLRAQAVSPTGAPNPPFVRVDFYRRVTAAGVDHWSYLGSQTAPIASDQGTYRSWVWALPSFVASWTGAAQGAVAANDQIMAVGVNSVGDAIATVNTTMIP